MTLLKTACHAKSVFHPLQNRIESENVPLQQQKEQRHFFGRTIYFVRNRKAQKIAALDEGK